MGCYLLKFHPVVSVILGYIVFFIFLTFSGLAHLNFGFNDILAIISYFFAGFIAVYLAKEKKIRYGLYMGIFLISFALILVVIYREFIIYDLIFLVIVFTCLGGFLGKMTDLNNRKSFETEYVVRGINPLIAIIIAGIIAEGIYIAVSSPIIDRNYSFGAFNFLAGAGFFLIGGFITTLLAREEKLRYGIYFGIILAVIFFH